jgi:hypothetical protein
MELNASPNQMTKRICRRPFPFPEEGVGRQIGDNLVGFGAAESRLQMS